MRGLLGPHNHWKWTTWTHGRTCSKFLRTCLFCEKQKNCGRTLGHKGLVKHNETIKDHKNTSSDSLKPFSASYSTIWCYLCGKFDEIATHVQWEGSHKQKIKHHALNEIGDATLPNYNHFPIREMFFSCRTCGRLEEKSARRAEERKGDMMNKADCCLSQDVRK